MLPVTPKISQRITNAAAVAAVAAILAGAIWILFRQFRAISLHAVYAALAGQPASHIALSLLFTAISFAALASYDVFASRIVAPGRVSSGCAILAGASANAVGNMLGFHAVTASAVRYRLYRQAGLGLDDVARIVSLSGAAIGLAFATMLAIALIAAPLLHPSAGPSDLRSLAGGLAIAAALALLVAWLSRSTRTVGIARFRITLPPARLAALQMAIGAVEMSAAIGALYILLPADLAPSFATFCVGMTIALVLGVAGHTPGGLGVFEVAIVSVLGGGERADLLAALLLYRLFYYAVPFAVSLAALGVFEMANRGKAAPP